MKFRTSILAIVLIGAPFAKAQVASHGPVSSHAPDAVTKTASAKFAAPADVSAMAAKPVVRVNGAVLTEIDLKREMNMMFPYAQQHGGNVPKSMEGEIRKGALDMIIFEELLYQDAKRRNVQVPAEKLNRSVIAFRKQFADQKIYKEYLNLEFGGSEKNLREKIRRSLLIERMLKTEVNGKAIVTTAAARAYYNANPKQFEHGETVAIQTISIIPPNNATPEMTAEARAKIKDIARLGKAAKSTREFGLIAEQLSDDDWRMKMGDRGFVEVSKLPPEVVKAARAMKPGQVSDVVQLGTAYVVFRLNARKPAGKSTFLEVRKALQAELQKQKISERRAELNKLLHRDSKIEVL